MRAEKKRNLGKEEGELGEVACYRAREDGQERKGGKFPISKKRGGGKGGREGRRH